MLRGVARLAAAALHTGGGLYCWSFRPPAFNAGAPLTRMSGQQPTGPPARTGFGSSSAVHVTEAFLRREHPAQTAWQADERRVVCYVPGMGFRPTPGP